jgi:hypothetical protein
MWREFIESLGVPCNFRPPATQEMMVEAEQALHSTLPTDLRSFILESNGLYDEHEYSIIVWSIDEIVKTNLWFRQSEEYARSHMTFQSLLFFANAGVDGVLFGFRITASGEVQNRHLIVWYPLEDSRPVVAFTIEDYLKRWLTGKLTV